MSKVHARSHQITNKPLRVRTTKTLPTIMYRSIPKPPMPSPPPGQTPGHLTFLKIFGQIPRYVASLDSQMPHPLELQRGSNPPPSRHVKQTMETREAPTKSTVLYNRFSAKLASKIPAKFPRNRPFFPRICP